MAIRRPLSSVISSGLARRPASASQPSGGFGAARAEQLQNRLSTAFKERRVLAGAASAADAPVSDYLAQRGEMVARKIDRLSSELKDTE